MHTMSPSRMVGAMLSPWQVRAKSACQAAGTPMYRSMFCSAVMGLPQAIEPIRGTRAMAGSGSKPGGSRHPFLLQAQQPGGCRVERAAAKSSILF